MTGMKAVITYKKCQFNFSVIRLNFGFVKNKQNTKQIHTKKKTNKQLKLQ